VSLVPLLGSVVHLLQPPVGGADAARQVAGAVAVGQAADASVVRIRERPVLDAPDGPVEVEQAEARQHQSAPQLVGVVWSGAVRPVEPLGVQQD